MDIEDIGGKQPPRRRKWTELKEAVLTSQKRPTDEITREMSVIEYPRDPIYEPSTRVPDPDEAVFEQFVKGESTLVTYKMSAALAESLSSSEIEWRLSDKPEPEPMSVMDWSFYPVPLNDRLADNYEVRKDGRKLGYVSLNQIQQDSRNSKGYVFKESSIKKYPPVATTIHPFWSAYALQTASTNNEAEIIAIAPERSDVLIARSARKYCDTDLPEQPFVEAVMNILYQRIERLTGKYDKLSTIKDIQQDELSYHWFHDIFASLIRDENEHACFFATNEVPRSERRSAFKSWVDSEEALLRRRLGQMSPKRLRSMLIKVHKAYDLGLQFVREERLQQLVHVDPVVDFKRLEGPREDDGTLPYEAKFGTQTTPYEDDAMATILSHMHTCRDTKPPYNLIRGRWRVPWEKILPMIAKRQCFVYDGWAYLEDRHFVDLVATRFREFKPTETEMAFVPSRARWIWDVSLMSNSLCELARHIISAVCHVEVTVIPKADGTVVASKREARYTNAISTWVEMYAPRCLINAADQRLWPHLENQGRYFWIHWMLDTKKFASPLLRRYEEERVGDSTGKGSYSKQIQAVIDNKLGEGKDKAPGCGVAMQAGLCPFVTAGCKQYQPGAISSCRSFIDPEHKGKWNPGIAIRLKEQKLANELFGDS